VPADHCCVATIFEAEGMRFLARGGAKHPAKILPLLFRHLRKGWKRSVVIPERESGIPDRIDVLDA
jgi:hypothetical protein